MEKLTFGEKFFPFGSAEAFNYSLFTSLFTILILLVIILSSLYLLIKFCHLHNKLKSEENFKSTKAFKRLWDIYEDTFQDFSSGRKTKSYSDVVFSENSILFTFMNYRLINVVGNLLVGLGVLGTFCGLAYGVQDSDFSNSIEIEKSINELLTGMGTAFNTSIWGMGTSLVYTLILKIFHTKVSRKIDILCSELDDKYRISDSDLEKVRDNNLQKMFKDSIADFFVYDADGIKQYPKNVLRRLLKESEQQTSSLQSFADDLAENLQGVFDEVIKGNREEIGKLIKEQLVPVLIELKNLKQESGVEVIKTLVTNITNSFSDMLAEMKESITGNTKSELENLAEKLSLVSAELIDLPKAVSSMAEDISLTVDMLKETVVDGITKSKEEAERQSINNSKIIQDTTKYYKSTAEELQANMKMLLELQKENVTRVDELNNSVKNTLDKNKSINSQFGDVALKVKESVSVIERVYRQMDNNSMVLVSSTETLAGVIGDFKAGSTDFYDKNKEIVSAYIKTLQETKEMSAKYIDNMGVIEGGIKNIFEDIQEGLIKYQETSGSVLNDYLDKFSTAFSDSQENLSNNITMLSEFVEDLSEAIAKSKKDLNYV